MTPRDHRAGCGGQRRASCGEPHGGACAAQDARSAVRLLLCTAAGSLRDRADARARPARCARQPRRLDLQRPPPVAATCGSACRGASAAPLRPPEHGTRSRSGSPTPPVPRPRRREMRGTSQGSSCLVALNAIDHEEPAPGAAGVQVTISNALWWAVPLVALALATRWRGAAPGYLQPAIGSRRRHEQVIAFATTSRFGRFLAIKDAVRISRPVVGQVALEALPVPLRWIATVVGVGIIPGPSSPEPRDQMLSPPRGPPTKKTTSPGAVSSDIAPHGSPARPSQPRPSQPVVRHRRRRRATTARAGRSAPPVPRSRTVRATTRTRQRPEA